MGSRTRASDRRGLVLTVILLLVLAASFGCDGTKRESPAPPVAVSVVVTPADPTIAQGSSRQLAATAVYSDGSMQDVTASATWTSSEPDFLSVAATGVVSATLPGSATVSATLGALSGSTAVAVPGADETLASPFGFHPAAVARAGYPDSGYVDATRIGVRWTRSELYAFWFKIQPSLDTPTYDFSENDQMYMRVPAGMRILGNIAPQGPRDEGRCLPGSYLPIDEAQYVAFVKATVERYDGDGSPGEPALANPIKYWQVGNEPNDSVTSDFADLQRITYLAIKEACPDCVVLMGGVPGMPPASAYDSAFDRTYANILATLNGQYVDVFDFHWYGNATGDYLGARTAYDHIRDFLGKHGFAGIPIWITEMGSYSGDPLESGPGFPIWDPQTEREQALDYFKRFVFPLSFGVEKVFPAFGLMEGMRREGGYFDYTGLVYDGWDRTGTSYDLGLGVKKLGYYTYWKMTEALEGADWSVTDTVRDSDDVHVYRLTKNGHPLFVAWWDYFYDPTYAPGATVDVSLDVEGSAAVATEVLPHFDTGEEVTDFASAFDSTILTPSGGTVTVHLGDSPVVVNVVP